MTDLPPPAVWFLTGMSGAGKQAALDALVGLGVDCVDNLPVDLMDGFAVVPRTAPAVAVVDARAGSALARITRMPPGVRVIFLDAADDVLVRRLSESTRRHPCREAGNAPAQVAAERGLLTPLRAAADVVIDTSALTPADLADRIGEMVLPDGAAAAAFRCVVSSFGYKHGPQTEADWVIDVRFLPNPFWNPELRPMTGLDAPVSAFVLDASETKEFLEQVGGLLAWVVDQSERRHRTSLHIAVGCTGGRHRSVAVSEALAARLRSAGVDVVTRHRDVQRPDPR